MTSRSGGKNRGPGTGPGLGLRTASLTGNSSNSAPPTPKEQTVTQATAKNFLIISGLLDKDEPITIRTITRILNVTAATKVDMSALRNRVSAIAFCFESHMLEMLVESTTTFLMERMESLKREGKIAALAETAHVRKELEENAAKLQEEKNALDEERKIWMETREALTICEEKLKNTADESRKKLEELTNRLSIVTGKLEQAEAQRQQAPAPFAPLPSTAARGSWADQVEEQRGNGFGLEDLETGAHTYALATNSPQSALTDPAQQLLDPEFKKLKGSEEKRDRQIMLDKVDGPQNSTPNVNSLLAEEILDKVNNAIQKLEKEVGDELRIGKPDYIKCLSVQQQRNGGALLNLNTSWACEWISQPEVSAELIKQLGFQAKIIPRRYKVVAQNLPVSVNLEDEGLATRIEQENDLYPGDVLAHKWIRSPSKREANQRTAFAVLDFRTKNAANRFLGGRGTVEQYNMVAVKYMSEVLRCFNCQKAGHIGKNCKAEKPVCGTCSGEHTSHNCVKRSGPFWCTTCKAAGHATWDCACPNFYTKNVSKTAQNSDRMYKYFVTHERWTWEPASLPTRGPPRARATMGDVVRHRFTTGANSTPISNTTQNGTSITQEQKDTDNTLTEVATPAFSLCVPPLSRSPSLTLSSPPLDPLPDSLIPLFQQQLDDLIFGARPDGWCILSIQEPPISSFKISTSITQWWYPVYPVPIDHPDRLRTRSLLLINRNISTNCWKQIHFNHPDITGVIITTNAGNVHLINLYNDCNNDDSYPIIRNYLTSLPASANVILQGDFNRHHPRWDDVKNAQLFTEERLTAAQHLIDFLDDYNLTMALPPDIPTHKHNVTGRCSRLDNIFTTPALADRVTQCDSLVHERTVCTDHFSIITTFDLSYERAETVVRHNFKAVDWSEFGEELRSRVTDLDTRRIQTVAEFERKLAQLTNAITDAIDAKVPRVTITPYTKRWWTSELTTLRNRRNNLANRSSRHTDHEDNPVHEEFAQASRLYRRALETARNNCWDKFIDEVDGAELWNAHRYLKSDPTDGGATRIPSLTRKLPGGATVSLDSNEEKSQILYETFFPVPANTTSPRQNYPEEVTSFEQITERDIEAVISNLQPYKTPGPDGIPNCVYIHCKELLIPLLLPLYRATFDLDYYPNSWKTSTTVVLRKPEKPDYASPKAYRPIALLNVISKILSSCIASRLNNIAEKFNLLPAHHFGGRPGRTTTDSMHLLTSYIKKAWREKQVVSALFLDVSGAFPNASPKILAHNMRKKGFPEQYVSWMERKLEGRTTQLRFDDYTSEPFEIRHGIDQGCPLSCINYCTPIKGTSIM